MGVLMMVPQLRLLNRASAVETQGVASITWIAIVASTVSTAGYGFTSHNYSIVPGNAASAVMGCWVTLVLLRLRGKPATRIIALWLSLAVLAFATRSVPGIAGWIGTGFAVIQRQPQIKRSLRHAREGVGSGVSLGTWWFSASCHVLWIGYGIAAHNAIVFVANTIMLVQSLVIIAIESSQVADRSLTVIGDPSPQG